MAENVEERTLEETPTWAVAVVCFVMIALSLGLEHLLHILEKWLHSRHKKALHEALEKVKAELMLMGFISLLLTIGQYPISGICVSPSIANTWHPCKRTNTTGARRVLSFLYSTATTAGGGDASSRRILASTRYDKCAKRGDKVAFVSAYGIHQLHIFIFILAIFHVIYCLTTLALGSTKMKRWESWEDEARSIEHQYHDDPDRFRFARDTSFGRRHLNNWSSSSITLWIMCFFRQFSGSVKKVDYFALRHGFIMAHLPPGSETKFDFHKYLSRSLEQDFVVVVGITPVLWFISMLFLLTNTHGWMAYLWLPFIPLIILLLVGTKLLVIITELGLRIQERGKVVRGAPVVQPGDELFWFNRPRLILFLIHLVLFQNAFQLAFFIWTLYTFTIKSCFHEKLEDILIRVIMGIIIQILCSYVTLPLYALVTQMGTTMKPTIFNERVAEALKNWHHSARSNTRHGRLSGYNTPISSRPASPSRSRGVSPVPSRSRGMSPVHLLHSHPTRCNENYQASPSPPRHSSYGEDNDRWDPESLHSLRQYHTNDHHGEASAISEQEMAIQEMAIQEPPGPIRTPDKISKSPSGFSFGKRGH